MVEDLGVRSAMTDAEWPFDQGPNTAAIASRSVFLSGALVRIVVHYSDDHSWAFLDGDEGSEADAAVVSMAEAVERDGTLREVADLPPGWVATRERMGGAWVRGPDPSV
jgi:hypothetical protein